MHCGCQDEEGFAAHGGQGAVEAGGTRDGEEATARDLAFLRTVSDRAGRAGEILIDACAVAAEPGGPIARQQRDDPLPPGAIDRIRHFIRPARRVFVQICQADAEGWQQHILFRHESPGRQSRLEEEWIEAVAGMSVVVTRLAGTDARVRANKDEVEARRENIRQAGEVGKRRRAGHGAIVPSRAQLAALTLRKLRCNMMTRR